MNTCMNKRSLFEQLSISVIVLDLLLFAVSVKLQRKPVPVRVLNVQMKKQTSRGDQPPQLSLGVFFVKVEKPRGREAVLHLCGSQPHHRKARTSRPGPSPPCPGPEAKPAL